MKKNKLKLFSALKRHTLLLYTGMALLVTNPAFSLEALKPTVSSSTASGHNKEATLPGLQNILDDQADHFHEQTNETNESEEAINTNPVQGADKMVGHVRGLYDKVVTNGLKSKLLDPVASYKLPLAISKQVLNTEQLVIIDSVVFTPKGNYINAAVSLDYPSDESKRLDFYGAGIGFHRGGFEGTNARVYLLNDNVSVGSLNENMELSFTGVNRKTFVEFDCNGFQQFSIDARVSFSRKLLLPVDGQGNVLQGDEKVTATFTQVMADWSELMVETSIQPFQVKGLKDFVFQANNIALDMSDISNPLSLAFPPDYPTPNMPLWRGVFIQDITVKLPPYFKKASTSAPPEIAAHNLVIDEYGVTGLFAAANLLPMDEGSMAGWAFSLDSIAVELFTGTLNRCGFSGKISLPLGEEGNEVNYTGDLDFEGNYFFSLEQTDKLPADMWCAELNLQQGSQINVTVSDGKFMPSALLNGDISLDDKVSQKIKVEGIDFQGLCLQTVQPHISAQAFALNGNERSTGGGFPISLNKVAMVNEGDDIGLAIDATLNLTGSSNGSFGANSGFTVWAMPRDNDRGLIAYKYKETKLGNISVDMDAGAFRVNGELIAYENDPVYGQGYAGKVDVWFLPGISVKSTGQFGNVDNFRYWYVDAMLGIPAGITVFPAFSVYGFGGGASMHMKRQEPDDLVVLPDEPEKTVSSEPGPGVSLSGITYVPDKQSGLGVRASLTGGVSGNSSAFNVKVAFEMIFHSNGGLKQLSMDGSAGIMSPIEAPVEDKKFYGTVNMTYDVTEKSFFCNSKVYMSVAGGVIKGSGPNNLVGTTELLFAKDNWYIYVGKPESRVSVTILSMIKTDSYFMTGKDIPPMPDVDPRIKEVLNITPGREGSVTSLEGGPGFAFGSSLSISTGEKSLGPFYAQFDALVGFDVMMKDFGEVSCAGMTGVLGINGWYATGQLYAYLSGNVGIKVDMSFYKGNFEILSGEFGALLEAQLPNPSWMKGQVAGNYSILNGLVSGKCRFEFEIGEECEIDGAGALAGLDVISTITPAKGEKDVSVYNSPQAVFNMQVEEPFSIEEMDGTTKTVKIVLDQIYLESNGQKLSGDVIWNSSNDVVSYRSKEILPPEQEVTFKIRIVFKEYRNRIWSPVKVEGKDAAEEEEITFTVGKAPPYISPENIEYAYPLDKQRHVYKNESDIGYVQLYRGRKDLFEHDPDWEQVAQFNDGQHNIETSFNYLEDEMRLEFNLPGTLQNSKVYYFSIINKPLKSVEATDQNVSDANKDMGDGKYDMKAKVKEAEGTIDYLETEVNYEIDFATSKYNSFAEKINGLNIINVQPWFVGETGVYSIFANYRSDEYFDEYEIDGNGDAAPLVRVSLPGDNNWYNSYIYPVIYEPLPIADKIDLPQSRYNDEDGVPPLKAFYIYHYETILLTKDEIRSKMLQSYHVDNYIHYKMPRITNKDYTILKNDCSGYYLNTSNQALKDIIEIRYKNPFQGDYKIQFEYYLPGNNSRNASTTKEFYLDL